MSLEEILEHDTIVRRIPHLADSHLKSPILSEERELFKKCWLDPKTPCPRYIQAQIRKFRKLLKNTTGSPYISSEELYGDIYSGAIHGPATKSIRKTFTKARQLALLDIGTIGRGIGTLSPSINESLRDHLDKITSYIPSEIENNLLIARESWDYIQRKMSIHRANPQMHPTPLEVDIPGLNDAMGLLSSGFLLLMTRGKTYLFDYEQVLCILDTITSRQLVCLYAGLVSHNPNIYTPDEETVVHCYDWGDNILKEFGNEGYTLIKFWEPIILGTLLQQVDTWSLRTQFRDTMLKDYHSKLAELGKKCVGTCSLCNLLVDVVDPLTNSYVLSELFGLYRHWGHPTVRLEPGCLKVQKVAKLDKHPNLVTRLQVAGGFTRYFIISYIKRHGHWPPVDTSLIPDSSPLKRAAEAGMMDFSDFDEDIPIEDWNFIQFGKCFQFDYFEDWSQLIEDKAIAPYLKDWKKIYDPELLGFYEPQDMVSSRRVIIECLTQEKIDVKRICKVIMSRNIPQDWKILLVHAKEREMKLDPRLFAMMVLEMRLYFCATEANIARQIMPYFPQQTMTLSEIDLTHRLLQLTHEQEGESAEFPVYINIDYEKWNLQWRESSTHSIFTKIDQMFGTPGLLSYTHKFFSELNIFISHRLSVPPGTSQAAELPTKESAFYWTKHLGGLEGLRQKAWTLVTTAILLEVSRRSGMKMIITGQGDNQVLKLSIPKENVSIPNHDYLTYYEESVLRRIKEVMDLLESTSLEMGLPIKREETWISTHVFAYGKDMIVKGAFLPGAFKKIGRVYFEVNEVFPTCESKLATIHTSGQAAAQKGDYPLISYTISLMESYYSLLKDMYHPSNWSPPLTTYLKTKGESDILELVRFCCLFPRSLGGFPVSNILSYLYRGHPDPVTEGLSFIKILAQEDPLFKRALSWLSSFNNLKPGEPDLSMLIQDPPSVNWNNPPLPANIIKNLLSSSIRGITKNKEVKMLFHRSWEEEDEALVQTLSSANPMSPRILNDLYMKSPTGQRLGFLATFSNMRSTQLTLGDDNKMTAVTKVKSAERGWIQHMERILGQIKRTPVKNLDLCLTELAQNLRDKSWYPNGEKTIVGITVPHPIEQFHYIIHEQFCESPDSPYALIIYDPGCSNEKYQIHNRPSYARGKYAPYLGSQTTEKKTGVMIPLPRSTPSIKAAQRLSQVKSWAFSEDPTTQKIIDKIISCRTNLTPETLILSSGYVYGGSLTHRYNDPMTSHEVLSNLRPNFLSHLCISSDTLQEYSRGVKDVTLHFQGMFLLGATLMHIHCTSEDNWRKRYTMHAHVHCTTCTKEIEDVKVTLQDVNLQYAGYADCPLLYTHIEGHLNYDIVPVELITKVVDPSSRSTIQLASDAAACILESNHRRIMSSSYRGRSELIVCPGTRGLDIQEFLSITFPRLLSSLAIVCIYDRAELAMDIYNNTHLDLIKSYTVALQKNPHTLWSQIRSHLVLPEASHWLIGEAKDVLPSSESWKGGSSLDLTLTRMLVNEVRKTLERMKTGWIPTFTWFFTGSFTQHRHLLCWMNLVLVHLVMFEKVTSKPDLLRIRKGKPKMQGTLQNCVSKMLGWFNTIMTPYYKLGEKADLLISLMLTYLPNPPEIYIRASREQRLEDTSATLLIQRCEILPHHENITLDYDNIQEMIESRVTHIPLFYEKKFVHREVPMTEVNLTAHTDILPGPKNISYRADHQHRLVGLYSTAPYKYLDLICKYSERRIKYAMCLAEGAGGLCRMFLDGFQCEEVFYDSLIDPSEFAAHRVPGYVPAEVKLSKNNHKLKGARESAEYGGDLLSKRTINRIINVALHSVDIITCDAEISGDQNPIIYARLLHNVLKIAQKHLHPLGIVIFKTFCRSAESLATQIGMMTPWFERVYLSIPISSSHESTECFLVGVKTSKLMSRSVLLDRDQQSVSTDYTKFIKDIVTLRNIRSHHRPFQQDYLEHWKLLNDTLATVFESNWTTSWICYFGALSIKQDCNVKAVIQECKRLMDITEVMLAEHMTGLSELQSHMRVDLLGRELLNASSADRLSLSYHATCWSNAKILRSFKKQLGKAIPSPQQIKDAVQEKRLITKNNCDLWLTCEDIGNWFNKFGRPFYHICGHLYNISQDR